MAMMLIFVGVLMSSHYEYIEKIDAKVRRSFKFYHERMEDIEGRMQGLEKHASLFYKIKTKLQKIKIPVSISKNLSKLKCSLKDNFISRKICLYYVSFTGSVKGFVYKHKEILFFISIFILLYKLIQYLMDLFYMKEK